MLYVKVMSPRAQKTIEKLKALLSLWLYVRVTPFGLKNHRKLGLGIVASSCLVAVHLNT